MLQLYCPPDDVYLNVACVILLLLALLRNTRPLRDKDHQCTVPMATGDTALTV